MNTVAAPNARQIIMGLLGAERNHPLTARQIVMACRIFGIADNSARVALARLNAAGLVESAQRGSYQLGNAASGLAGDIATWRDAQARLAPWSGRYLMVHSGALGRTDRTALRRRERALGILGLKALERDLYVRPDNLAGGVDGIRARLQRLGLEPDAAVFMASDFDPKREQRLHDLWDTAGLNRLYREQTDHLTRWLARVDTLDLQDAARESFLLGGQAIRQIVFDPLLPAPLVEAEARRQFIDTVKHVDQVGHDIWKRLFETTSVSGASGPSISRQPSAQPH